MPRPRRLAVSGWGRLPPAGRSAVPRGLHRPRACSAPGRCGPRRHHRRSLPSSAGWRWKAVLPLHRSPPPRRWTTRGRPARGSAAGPAHRRRAGSPCATAHPRDPPAALRPADDRCVACSRPRDWRLASLPAAAASCDCCAAPLVPSREERRWPPGAGWRRDPPVVADPPPG